MEKFYRKAEMLAAIKEVDVEPELFIDFLNSKEKHNFTYFETHKDLFKNINEFVFNSNYYINEIILNGQMRKPYLDLEKVYPDEETYKQNYKTMIKKLLEDIIQVFKSQYNEDITEDDILLLNSSGEVGEGFKISFHIIVSPEDRTLYYTNSKYSTSAAYHFYTSLIDLDQSYTEILDCQVYNSDVNFRIIESAKKFSDKRILQPIDKLFKKLDLTDQQKLPYFLTYIGKQTKQLTTPLIEQTTRSNRVISKNAPTQTDINNKLLQVIQEYHPTAVYNGLYNDIYHNFNYTDRQEKCPISGKVHTGSNGFFVVENERGYYLKCHSKNCPGVIHIGYADESSDFIDNAHQIDQPYLIIDGDIKKNPVEVVKDLIKEWLVSDDKTLAVKSAMGTGKTTMIHKILKYDKSLKKILWITHRQTLTKQIFGSFKSENFTNYMEEKNCLFDHDRIIVQVDSLMRIIKYENSNIVFKEYDLVIIDEIEGCLNHYNSPYLNKFDYSARDKFKFMLECIDSARKLLVLDADIGMRTKLFIDHFGKATVINNNYKPMKKIFTMTNDSSSFDKQMFDDIVKHKKNVCIVSMSAGALEKIKAELQQKNIKHVMHTSKTDDQLKNELEDVNNFWTQYQVVLYSPTIESGVDFNEEYFDKIYCIVLSGPMTCSQRGFLQMVGRIRKIKDPNILCSYDRSIKLDSSIYTYDDVLSYFRYYEDLNGRRIIENVEYKKTVDNGQVNMVRVTTNISLFDHISVYNEVEKLNQNDKIFMTVLNKLIQKAGHDLKFDMIDPEDMIRKKRKVGTIPEEEKMARINELEYDIPTLMRKQANNKLDEKEKLVLTKFFFMKTFGINDSGNKKEFSEFGRQFKRKIINFKRYEKLFGYKPIQDDEDDNIDNYNDGKDKARHKIIIDLVRRLTGNDEFIEANKKSNIIKNNGAIDIENDEEIKIRDKNIIDIYDNELVDSDTEVNDNIISIYDNELITSDNETTQKNNSDSDSDSDSDKTSDNSSDDEASDEASDNSSDDEASDNSSDDEASDNSSDDEASDCEPGNIEFLEDSSDSDSDNEEIANEVIIDNEQYMKAIKDIAKNSLYFTNEQENRALFFKAKGKFKPINKRNQRFYTKTIKTLLDTYNIILEVKNRVRKNKKRVYIYSLSVGKQIKDIVQYKYGEVNKVNGFPNLFIEK